MLEIINKYNIKAKKSLWQNFLINKNILDNIWNITKISGENIVEVWPGFWVLTEIILQKTPSSLCIVELDTFMIDVINRRIKNDEINIKDVDFSIINSDILKYTPNYNDYKIIANIPYYITSPILKRFLYDVKNPPKEMIILMQKEVWDRIIDKKSSVLSLFINKKTNVSSQIFVPKNCFYPAPKIDSSLLHFVYDEKYSEIDDNVFLDFIKKCFSNPRKKLLNNLLAFDYEKNKIIKIFQELNLSENSRAEDLNLDMIISLIKKIWVN